jgi:putative spermidine/putrescine transport system substrate-binding protein
MPHVPTSKKIIKKAIVADPIWWADNGAEVSERFGAWKGN